MSRSSKRLLSILLVTFVFLYLISPLGATYLGVISPEAYLPAIAMMGILSGLWFWVRIRSGWDWHRTSFDAIFVLWGIAFAVSIIANPETMRRSMIGLWYMLLYLGIWYVLHDVLSNRGVTRKLLVDALLNAGILVMVFSFVQLANQDTFRAPVSIIGNPNALGAVLLAMAPFAVQRALTATNRIGRVGWGFYSLIVIANLLLSLSRGAWLGLFVALIVLIVLLLKHFDMLSRDTFRAWWEQRTIGQRRLMSSLVILALAVTVVAGLLFLNSFSIAARRPELRTRLWNSALRQFAEKPITGQGFYTFGRDYGLSISIPPAESHAHAHSMPLNIMAEMGLVGLVVFLLSVVWIMRLIWQRWHDVPGEDRLTWIAAIATLIGFGVHHLFDLPAMMPIVALVGLLVLVLVCAPFQPQPIKSSWYRIGRLLGLVVLWIGLMVSGIWSGNIYKQYWDTMLHSFSQEVERTDAERMEAYHETAKQLSDVVAQDTLLPIYHQQQALVWGLLAASGDEDAIQQGIDAYQRFLELEPNHAISWANLSALQWQADDTDAAILSIERAIELAPGYSLFQQNLQVYRGDLQRDPLMSLPDYIYNENFARFEFLREPLNRAFLPQIGWGNNHNN